MIMCGGQRAVFAAVHRDEDIHNIPVLYILQVAAAAGVRESGWLGLQYQDIRGTWCWLHDQNKVCTPSHCIFYTLLVQLMQCFKTINLIHDSSFQ